MNNFNLEPYLTKNTAKLQFFLMQYFYYIDSTLGKAPENITHDEISVL